MPIEAKSLALIMDDPDIPQFVKDKFGIEVFDHWTLFNIPPETREIPEGATIGTVGLHSAGGEGYTGPCPPPRFSRSATTMKIQVGSSAHEPPPEHEPSEHRYIFKLYALSDTLRFEQPPTKQQVLDALAPFLLAETELVGRYARS